MRIFKTATLNRPSDTFLENARMSGVIRKPSWIYKRALAGYFYKIEGEEQALLFTKVIDSAITELNKQFKDNWDFIIRPIRVYVDGRRRERWTLFCQLRFEKFIITNSNNDTHTIRDLFVEFEFYNVGLGSGEDTQIGIRNLTAFRTTATELEYLDNYAHSHLPSFRYKDEPEHLVGVEFCTGGTREAISQSLMSLELNYSSEEFSMFLFVLDSFVRWESLEGIPFFEMRTLYRRQTGNSRRLFNQSERIFSSVYSTMLPKLLRSKIPVNYCGNHFKIRYKEFELLLNNIILNFPDYYEMMLVKQGEGSEYYYCYKAGYSEHEPKTVRYLLPEQSYFLFRGTKIRLKIISNQYDEPFQSLNQDEIGEFKLHKSFIDYAKIKFEKQLLEIELRSSALRKHYKSTSS